MESRCASAILGLDAIAASHTLHALHLEAVCYQTRDLLSLMGNHINP